MKHLLVILVCLVAFVSCKKEDEPAPVPSARVAGTYDMSRIAYDASGTTNDYNITLPRSVSGISQTGSVVVEKFNNSDDAVTVVITVKTTGQSDQTIDLQDFDLVANSNGFDLTYQNVKYGTADGTNLNIDFTENGEQFIVVAKRR